MSYKGGNLGYYKSTGNPDEAPRHNLIIPWPSNPHSQVTGESEQRNKKNAKLRLRNRSEKLQNLPSLFSLSLYHSNWGKGNELLSFHSVAIHKAIRDLNKKAPEWLHCRWQTCEENNGWAKHNRSLRGLLMFVSWSGHPTRSLRLALR